MIINDRAGQNRLMLLVFLSVFMFSIDYSMLNISLPSVSEYFKVRIGVVAWLPMIYMLVVTSSLLGFGKLGDLKGYANVFLAGVGIFTAGSILCGTAVNMKMLLASRAFQSLGEAMMAPMGIALLTTALPREMRGLALGLVAMAQGLGFCVGPLVGGAINSHFIWRGIFFVNIPLGVFVILSGMKHLPKFRAETAGARFDILGAVLIFITVAALTFALNSGVRLGWTSPAIISSFVISILGGAAFVLQERRIDYPMLDFALFRDRSFTFATISAFFALFVGMGMIFIGPFYLEYVRGLAVGKAGIVFMAPSIMMTFVAPVAGRLSDRFGSRVLCSVGMALAALASLLFSMIGVSSPIYWVVAAFALFGMAMGLFLAPNNKLIMSLASTDKQGVVSGVYKITANIGSIMGIAIIPLVMIESIRPEMAARNITMADLSRFPDIVSRSFHNGFFLAMIVCLAGLIFALLAKDQR